VNLSSPHLEDERRQYFRIRNSLLMSYQTIEAGKESQPPKKSQTDTSPCIHLLKELNKLEQQNDIFINSLPTVQSTVSNYISGVNNTLRRLSQYIVTHLDVEYRELMQVDLSGGGLRFESQTALTVGQELSMEIVLVPEYYNIVTHAKVVDCHKITGKQSFELAITFSQIHESDRDAIIKHVLEAQSKQLRSHKEKQTKDLQENEN